MDMRFSGMSVFSEILMPGVRASFQIHRDAEMPCAMIVASATPAAAISNLMTNSRSRKMFSTHATIRKISGVTESPRPRSTPETML